MRKIMKRKSRTPNSETSDAKDEDKSGDENNTNEEEDLEEKVTESTSKKSKKNKRQSKNAEENGTEKKSKKNKVEADSEEQYEVQQILDEKMVRGTRHYLIRWKGYEEDSDTWEPESTLNCPDLISKYQASKGDSGKQSGKHKESKKKKKRESKVNDKNEENDEEDENTIYEVDKIIEVHHKRNGRREFLVRWKGYSQAENTWEPEENMNCPDLIERFMAKVEHLRSLEAKELRVKRGQTDRFTLSMRGSGRRLSKRNEGKQRVHYFDAE